MKHIRNWSFSWGLGGVGDRLWWTIDHQGFRTDYLFSIHISSKPEYPGIRIAHLIIGPLRFLVARKSKQHTALRREQRG